MGQEKRERNIVNWHTARCFASELSVVRVTVQSKDGLVTINDFRQARASQERPNFRRLTPHGLSNG